MFLLPRRDERGVVVPACISGDRYFSKGDGCWLGEAGKDVRDGFVLASTARWQAEDVVLNLDIHGRVAEREELMAPLVARKPVFVPCPTTPKEVLHGLLRSEVDLVQEFAIDR